MQEGNRPIELRLGLLGAGDRKVNRAQGMVSMLLNLASRFACTAHKQHGY
jgi:hypothetical protein